MSELEKYRERHPSQRKMTKTLRESMAGILSHDFHGEFATFEEYLEHVKETGNGYEVLGARAIQDRLDQGMTMDDLLKLSKVLGEERVTVSTEQGDFDFFQAPLPETPKDVVSDQDGEGKERAAA